MIRASQIIDLMSALYLWNLAKSQYKIQSVPGSDNQTRSEHVVFIDGIKKYFKIH
jgi:hypothetical protein